MPPRNRRPRPLKPSAFPYDFCQNEACGTRKGVFYDEASRKHLCHRCWMETPKTPAVVIPTPEEVEEFGAGLDLT